MTSELHEGLSSGFGADVAGSVTDFGQQGGSAVSGFGGDLAGSIADFGQQGGWRLPISDSKGPGQSAGARVISPDLAVSTDTTETKNQIQLEDLRACASGQAPNADARRCHRWRPIDKAT